MNYQSLWNMLMKRHKKYSTLPPSGLRQSSLLTMWLNLLLISGKTMEQNVQEKSQNDS